jgi:predicted nucleotidyltransferase
MVDMTLFPPGTGTFEHIYGILADHPYPLVFVSVSGSHAYGFSSPNSDIDLRGIHNLPLSILLGLEGGHETHTVMQLDIEPEMDVQTHDLKKFIQLLLKKNGTMLEILCSPLVVIESEEYKALRDLVPEIVTKEHMNHYIGFAIEEKKRFMRLPRTKSVTYLFRILLTGIHLMRTGEVETNLETLGEFYHVPGVPDLVGMKRLGEEKALLTTVENLHYDMQIGLLTERLRHEYEHSSLREAVSEETRGKLNDLLIGARR